MINRGEGSEVGMTEKPVGNQGLEPEAELGEVLTDFRMSVHAWSAAAVTGPRTLLGAPPRRVGRMAVGWALGAALIAAGAGGGVYEHHRQELKIARQRAAAAERMAAEQRARQEEEDLLAKVDSEVSREVPSAMEPLAQLMAEDETR